MQLVQQNSHSHTCISDTKYHITDVLPHRNTEGFIYTPRFPCKNQKVRNLERLRPTLVFVKISVGNFSLKFDAKQALGCKKNSCINIAIHTLS